MKNAYFKRFDAEKMVALGVNFIRTRAFLFDRAKGNSLQKAFGISQPVASRVLSKIDKDVERRAHFFYPSKKISRREVINDQSILNIAFHADKPWLTGVLPEDNIKIDRVSWQPSNLTHNPGGLVDIFDAMVEKKPITIRYVTMRREDTGRIRNILPVSFLIAGESLRIVAHDLDDEKRIKTFLPCRIFETAPYRGAARTVATRISEEFNVRKRTYRATFNPILTTEQIEAICLEVGAKPDKRREDGRPIASTATIILHEISIADFKAHYCGAAVLGSDTAWPPFIDIKEAM